MSVFNQVDLEKIARTLIKRLGGKEPLVFARRTENKHIRSIELSMDYKSFGKEELMAAMKGLKNYERLRRLTKRQRIEGIWGWVSEDKKHSFVIKFVRDEHLKVMGFRLNTENFLLEKELWKKDQERSKEREVEDQNAKRQARKLAQQKKREEEARLISELMNAPKKGIDISKLPDAAPPFLSQEATKAVLILNRVTQKVKT